MATKQQAYKMRQRGFAQQIVMADLVKFGKIYLVPLGDFHIGNKFARIDIIQGYIDWIKNHYNAYTVLMGDMMECATKYSVPDLYEALVTPDDCYDWAKKLLAPIKHKILMAVRGNHEEMIWRHSGTDYTAHLARELGDIPYKPDGGMLLMRLGDTTNHHAIASFYGTHGWGGARTVGAKVKKPEEIALAVDADIIAVAHDHTQAIHRLNVVAPPRSRVSVERPNYLITRRRLLINTGGFVDYGGYVQRKGYVPQDLGTPRILIEFKAGATTRYMDYHASM